MAIWHITINLGYLVRRYRDGDLDITRLAEKVVKKIKCSGWRHITEDADEFDAMLEALAVARSEGEYMTALTAVYDLADIDRIWIETW